MLQLYPMLTAKPSNSAVWNNIVSSKKITVKSISVKAKVPSEKQEMLHHLQGASSELHAVDASDNTETVSQNEILFIYFLAVTVTGTHFLKGL